MVIDIPAEIIDESIRRLVQHARRGLDDGTISLDVDMHDPMHILGNTEQMLDIAAVSIAMRRIISLVGLN